MCGIAGVVGSAPVSVIEAMNDAMLHRGPDDAGVFADPLGRVALGHRRLSIIDMSHAGRQPMSYKNGRYQIVFNGEIYNHAELRVELEARGHAFVSNTDTEVILAAYDQWGSACLDKFRGMFAFAIFDSHAGDARAPMCFLARDRFGIKPLYYTKCGPLLVFASEIGALLGSGLVPRNVDRQSVWAYLSGGAVPQPDTIISGVQSLPAGHFMTVSSTLETEATRYWNIASAGGARSVLGPTPCWHSAVEQLREKLTDAIRYHRVSDVPIACFLSGGLDSTAVAALMKASGINHLASYSLGYDVAEGAQGDERHWASLAASHIGTEHVEVIITPEDVNSSFDSFVGSLDQPSIDGLNSFLISKAVGAKFKVALSGLGGDELFAGYPHFRRYAKYRAFDIVGDVIPAALKSQLRHIPRRLVPDIDFYLMSRAERYSKLRELVTPDFKREMVAGCFLQQGAEREWTDIYSRHLQPEMDSITQTSFVEINQYLVNTLLRDVDAVSMAHSLEVRPVLLDHHLAEFAFNLPSSFKEPGKINKALLAESVSDLLPQGLASRKKQGFELPLTHWLNTCLRERARDAFNSQSGRAIFSRDYLGAVNARLNGSSCSSYSDWANFILLCWLEKSKVSI